MELGRRAGLLALGMMAEGAECKMEVQKDSSSKEAAELIVLSPKKASQSSQ